MKIDLQQLSTNAIESTTGNKKMRLSENASSMVFQLFTKNVYSNPIGTVVREITSNCFDSHIEAGINAPVVIRKHKDENTNMTYISFIDFGVGMSPDRVENIYGVYFESTKRVDNTQIGGFGIGGKTPLAYKRSTGMGETDYDNSFFVITIHNGVKYYYCIFEGTDSPEISLLHSEETTEGNGTEIRIPVLAKDIETFANEMVRQLYYFENVIFEGFENSWKANTLTNQYQIVRGENFLFRGSEYSGYAHVCLGRVAYPIDYAVLGLSSSDYNLPIALKLEVGDINVTVSRENLDYSDKTIQMLRTKLNDAVAEVKGLLTKQYEEIVTLENYFTARNNFGTLYFDNGMELYVGSIMKFSDVEFKKYKYNDVNKTPSDSEMFKLFFETTSYGVKPKRSKYSSNNYEFTGGMDALKSKHNVLNIAGEFKRKVIKQAYLKAEYSLFHIVKRRDLLEVSGDDYKTLFGVKIDNHFDANGEYVPFIVNVLEMQKEYWNIVLKNTVNYDEFEVPEEFIANRKNKRSMITEDMRKETIPVKFNDGCRERVLLGDLFNYKMPIFYGVPDDAWKITRASNVHELLFDEKSIVYNYSVRDGFMNKHNHNGYSIGSKSTIMFIQVSTANLKYMEFCQNAMHIDKYYEKMLYRKADRVHEYFKKREVYELWRENLDYLYQNKNFGLLNEDWGKVISECTDYMNAIPLYIKNDKYFNSVHVLKIFFQPKEVKKTIEEQRIIDNIKSIIRLQTMNESYLKYIDSYNFTESTLNEKNLVLIDLLKKIMVF